MLWSVEALNDIVGDEILALPRDIRSKLEHISMMIESLGLERMREPYVKHLRGSLWEMRLIGRDGIARAIYVTASGRRIIVLHAFVKKTQKTPSAALNLALDRAKEIER